jgi:hypothetical protein
MYINIPLSKKILKKLNEFLQEKKIPLKISQNLKLSAHISILHSSSIVRMLNKLLSMFDIKYKYYIDNLHTCYKLYNIRDVIEEDVTVKINSLFIPRFCSMKKKKNNIIILISELFGFTNTNYNERIALIHNVDKKVQILYLNDKHIWDGKILGVTDSYIYSIFLINKHSQDSFINKDSVASSTLAYAVADAKLEHSIVEDAVADAKLEHCSFECVDAKLQQSIVEDAVAYANIGYNMPGNNTSYLWKQKTILNPLFCKVKQNIL